MGVFKKWMAERPACPQIKLKLFSVNCSKIKRKRSLIIGFGSKRSYYRNQNDHDSDKKIGSQLVWSDPEHRRSDHL